MLTALLASHHRNLMVVGDDDQSIYKFRGATIANILDFDKASTMRRLFVLEQNYRSTGNILNAANQVIAHNNSRKGKTLWTAAGEGEKIRVKKCDNQNARGALHYRYCGQSGIGGQAAIPRFRHPLPHECPVRQH